MSTKTLATVLILALTVGAAAGYVRSNPHPVETLWTHATAFGGSQDERMQAPYKPGKFYRLCRSEFSVQLRSRSLSDQQAACRCFDEDIRTWPPALQNAAHIGIYGTAALTKNLPDYDPGHRPGSRDIRRMSEHQLRVLQSQERDRLYQSHRDMQKSLGREAMEKLRANPLTTIRANRRLAALVNRCGIVDVPQALRNAPAAFDSIGAR